MTPDIHPRVDLQSPTIGGSPSYVQMFFENLALVSVNEVQLVLHSPVAKIIDEQPVRVRWMGGRWRALCNFEVSDPTAQSAYLPFELCVTAQLGDTTVGCWSGAFHVPRYVGDDVKTALQSGETLEVHLKNGVVETDGLGKGLAHTKIVVENGMALHSGMVPDRYAGGKSVAMHQWAVHLAIEEPDFIPAWRERTPQPHPWPTVSLGLAGQAKSPARFVRAFAKTRITFGRLELGLPAGEPTPDVWLYAMPDGVPTDDGATAHLSGLHLVVEFTGGAFMLHCKGRLGAIVHTAQGANLLRAGAPAQVLAAADVLELTANKRGIAVYTVRHASAHALLLERSDGAGNGYESVLVVPPETPPPASTHVPSGWPSVWHERGGFWWAPGPKAAPQPLDPSAKGGCVLKGPVLQGHVVAQPYPEFKG